MISGNKIKFSHRKAGRVGIILIHGNSSCKEVFAAQLKELAKTDLGVVIPDLPGHGGSDNSSRPSTTYSFPGYRGALCGLMKQLGYQSYHVVGWSLGGHIGLEMLAADEAVRSLLISGAPPIRLSPAGAAEGFRWAGTTAFAGRKFLSSDQIRQYVKAMMGSPIADDHHLSRMARRADGNARYWMVANGMAGHGADEVEIVARSDRPIAIVQGAMDPFLRIDYLARVPFKNLWQGRPVLLEAGHAPHWETPRPFNEAMMEFVTTH